MQLLMFENLQKNWSVQKSEVRNRSPQQMWPKFKSLFKGFQQKPALGSTRHLSKRMFVEQTVMHAISRGHRHDDSSRKKRRQRHLTRLDGRTLLSLLALALLMSLLQTRLASAMLNDPSELLKGASQNRQSKMEVSCQEQGPRKKGKAARQVGTVPSLAVTETATLKRGAFAALTAQRRRLVHRRAPACPG